MKSVGSGEDQGGEEIASGEATQTGSTDRSAAAILADRDRGCSIRQLAAKYGVPVRVVRDLVKRAEA